MYIHCVYFYSFSFGCDRQSIGEESAVCQAIAPRFHFIYIALILAYTREYLIFIYNFYYFFSSVFYFI